MVGLDSRAPAIRRTIVRLILLGLAGPSSADQPVTTIRPDAGDAGECRGAQAGHNAVQLRRLRRSGRSCELVRALDWLAGDGTGA